ncbi:MAG: PKD domain-containing protein [Sphingomonadales bacterium]|nr:PKD domain-containing protein [Sphingomonadales bacterium]
MGTGMAMAAMAGLAVSLQAQAPQAPAGHAYAPETDALFAQPYVDKDEWRDAPVRHRYVHGGFTGTDTKFSFYFPPKSAYHGRFYQHFTPAPDSENLGQQGLPGEENKVAFALSSGGYFVETNGGGPAVSGFGSKDPTVGAFRANAAAAAYSRVLALKMYGGRRPYGYIYGGSGGAYRTTGAFENTRGVWDGAVPYVLGTSMAIPNSFSVRMHAMRLLDGKFDQIVDAVEPGGSGDPYQGLTPEQADALREVTAMGFPPQSWFGWRTMGIHGFAALYGGVVMADPGYFTDFWTKPGYLGFDHPESFAGYRMQHATTVAAPITALEAAKSGLNTRLVAGKVQQGNVDDSYAALQGKAGQQVVAFRLAAAPPTGVQFLGGDLIVQSGAAKGERLMVMRIAGDVAVLGITNPAVAAKLAPGDAVQLDNSNFLAAQTYHRHQVPGPEFKVWDRFRGADGKPLYPQRPMLLGPAFTQATAGSVPSGNFDGKMILVESLWDREAYPWSADWYRARVAQHFGAQADAHFRLWYTDHALHGDSTKQEDATRTVSYLGVLHQALRDVAAWVETGKAPPASTAYEVRDGQVVVPATAGARHGIQPVVTLAANGGPRAVVKPGAAVSLVGTITAPPGTGSIIAAQWDFGDAAQAGGFAEAGRIARGKAAVTVRVTHRFERPGTYFVTLRGVSQRQGDAATPFARIQNLGRARVVVMP